MAGGGLYVVIHCETEPRLQEPVTGPARFPWHEVKKVDHYYLSVEALTQSMQVRKELPLYRAGRRSDEEEDK